MSILSRIRSLKKKFTATQPVKNRDGIDWEKWNNHPDKLEYIGWDEEDKKEKDDKSDETNSD